MNSIELVKSYINNNGFQMLTEGKEHVTFRYQMNLIYYFGNDDEYFQLTLADFDLVTKENISLVKERCNRINREIRQVKLYINDNRIIANSEIYYKTKEDFFYQIDIALKNLIKAKVAYAKLLEDEILLLNNM